MGVVHLGQRPGERPVAIKVLRPHVIGDDEARRRLAREVSSLSRVRSRRIAEIVDADPWGEIPYVATRYVPGLSLHDHVHEEGPASGDDLVWLADCLAEALEAVHAVGVLHRDIKPSNVIMEGRTPILIDFGLARVADDPKITMNGWLLGTPGFLAPEILHGDDASAAADVHSWAATVAFAGTGRGPFGRGPSVAVMDRVRRGEHDLTGLDPRVRPLVEHALDVDPAARPSLHEVREWLEDLGAPAHPPTPPAPASPVTLPLAAVAMHESLAPTRLEPDLRAVPDHEPWLEPAAYGSTEVISEEYGAPPVPRASAGERLRRSLLVLAGGATATAGIVAAPYVTLGVIAVAVWLLRSGSLATSAVEQRRRARGHRWYDGVQMLVGAPWHLVAGVFGTVLLLLWSLGIAVAAALLCFAFSASMTTSLGVIGASLVVATWWGPGSQRLRSPVGRVVRPLSRSPLPWIVSAALVAACAAGLAALVGSSGIAWTPADAAPFSGVRLPGWL